MVTQLPPSESRRSAKAAKLHYVDDSAAGITREKWHRTFRYFGPRGKLITNRRTLARIIALAIPPAWKHVWICPDGNGHLQATGRDARGRKQYRYHKRWRDVRDGNKYHHLIAFARALPRIRRAVSADLRRTGLPREKVLAAIVRLLEATQIRIGNEEYAAANHSYGLTTMRDRHATIKGSTIQFDFQGKSGVNHEIEIRDSSLARLVKQCQELPGQQLFQFTDENGATHTIGSSEVNDYLQAIVGQDLTAKDFRTWSGTVLATRYLKEIGESGERADAKRRVNAAIAQVAKDLGNTQAVCRKCYVHPAIIAAYLDQSLISSLTSHPARPTKIRLSPEERDVLRVLQRASQSDPQVCTGTSRR